MGKTCHGAVKEPISAGGQRETPGVGKPGSRIRTMPAEERANSDCIVKPMLAL